MRYVWATTGTPLRPIIPYCLAKGGEDGWQMLIALRDWWKTGVNDIGTLRPDTISPVPEGIPLWRPNVSHVTESQVMPVQQRLLLNRFDAAVSSQGAG